MSDITKNMNISKEQLIEKLTDSFIKRSEIVENSTIGQIYISAGPLDPKYFILCDGRKFRKLDPLYRKLYAAIGDTYRNDYNIEKYKSELLDAEFCVPNMVERGTIMQDTTGQLDDPRELNSNAGWSIPVNVINNFDMDSQTKIIINDPSPNTTDTESNNYGILKDPGNHITVTNQYSKFKIKRNARSGESVRLGDKLRFDSIYVYFYIKYRNIEDLSSDELVSVL